MFDVQEVYDKCKEAGLRDIYIGFKQDMNRPAFIILRLSCLHATKGVRVTQQVVYSKFEWPMMVNYVIGKLQRSAKE